MKAILALTAGLLPAASLLLAHDPHDPIQTVAVSPNYAQDQTVFAATDNLAIKEGAYLLLKSIDGGVTWAITQNMPNNAQMNAIVFSPGWATDQTLFVAGSDGLFRTFDGGDTWSQIYKQALETVALSPSYPTDNTLFAVTGKRTILKSNNRGNSWTTVSSPTLTGGLSAIALSPNYKSDHIILLGTDKDGIFVSTNAGSSWTLTTSGTTLSTVTGFAFSPKFATDQIVFASTLGSGVFASKAKGNSWEAASSGLTDLNVSSVFVSPTFGTDSTVWVTCGTAGIYQSTNRGRVWNAYAKVNRSLSSLTSVHYMALAGAPESNGALNLFLAMFEGLWTGPAVNPSFLYIDVLPTHMIGNIELSPNFSNDQTMFAGTYGGGVIWSTDAAADWTFHNVGLAAGYMLSGAYSPNFTNDGTVFITDVEGLQRSTDGGNTWQLLDGLGISIAVRTVAVSPNFANDNTILIGTEKNGSSDIAEWCPPGVNQPFNASQYSGAFYSNDAGTTWNPSNIAGKTGIAVIALSPNFTNDQTAFAASAQNGLYKTTDSGHTYTQLTVPVNDQKTATVALSPAFPTDNTVFIAMRTGGILKSTDGGNTWAMLPGAAALRGMTIQVSPNYTADQTIYIGTLQQGLVKFTNGGNSMATIASLPDRYITGLALSHNFASDQTMFASGYHGLYKSTDGGQTWAYTSDPARIEESRQAHSTTAPQDPPSITYSGQWTSVTSSNPVSTSYYMSTTESGDTALLNFVGSGVGFVSCTGPAQGSASVQLDGVSQGTISLNAPTDQFQQVVWQQQNLNCGRHTVVITALPQAGQSVCLDAFNISVSACPAVPAPHAH